MTKTPQDESKYLTRRLFLKLAALAGSALACNLPGRTVETLSADDALTPDAIVYVTATTQPTRPATPTLSSALDEPIPASPTLTSDTQPTVAAPQPAVVGEEPPVAATRTPQPTATRITEVALELGFVLANDAVNYAPNPAGCDRTVIRGALQDSAGNGVPDIFVRIRRDGSNIPTAVSTNTSGEYLAEVADELSDHTYRVQLTDETGARILSDPIIAQAIPDCNRNMMELNFVLRS